nr:Dihydrofolate reductase [uncultured bacterium]
MGKNRELGKGNTLLWHIPEDLKRFRTITNGHPCIMGRKTFESIVAILGKPLPNRTNIVVTRDKNWTAEGAPSVQSMEDAIQLAKRKPGGEEVFIIGGGEIYALGISYADKLYLTLIDDSKEADSFFPEYAAAFKKKVYEEEKVHEGLKYSWVDLER